ncbi:hypothetical protein [Actinomadura harenae]|uniref:Secreted protein n=1 Tax=Actinomadura harenae TaxID=2483351 RepID=A0A3M2MAS5_9ACTN|nr:hypothetical protein [Actinomadura harenae]RMI44238.1 hypothetical protein EBO15_13910 [Actinomadura harenae]
MKHIRITRGASVLAALSLGLTSLASVATAPAASATPAECASWPRPSSLPHGTVIREEALEGDKSIKLVVGQINGRQAGWAVIGGWTGMHDFFWLDVSTTGGNGNMQCGPFSSSGPNEPWWTPAHYASSDPNLRFRACARAAWTDYDVCTSWW